MSSTYYKFCSSRVILVKEDKVLLELRNSCEYACNQWMVPGGHTERDEKVIDSAIREMKEELDITLEKKYLRFVSVVHWWNQSYQRSGITFFWSSSKWEGSIKTIEQDKCSELRWFTKEETEAIDLETTSRKTLEAFFENRWASYIEVDWPEVENDAEDSEYDCE